MKIVMMMMRMMIMVLWSALSTSLIRRGSKMSLATERERAVVWSGGKCTRQSLLDLNVNTQPLPVLPIKVTQSHLNTVQTGRYSW